MSREAKKVSIEKETIGGEKGQWETQFEASLKKPNVKLMSAEERASVIAKIKKN
ncbi:MAG: hypothetical protein KKG76_06950 [Euryarchaeota archaeon]|nr:hypothetical protein [Euryarchaeota archaeon]